MWGHHWTPWPQKCGKWHTTCHILTTILTIMSSLVTCGGHTGFLPVKNFARGLQSLGSLNMYLHVLTCHMVQKIVFLGNLFYVISLHWQTILLIPASYEDKRLTHYWTTHNIDAFINQWHSRVKTSISRRRTFYTWRKLARVEKKNKKIASRVNIHRN